MFSNILLPVDLENEAAERRVAEAAAHMALREGAALHVLTVLPDFGMSIVGNFFPDDFEKKARAETAERLRLWAQANLPGEVKAEIHVGEGKIYDQIIRMAERLGCDLIVIGAHRPELRDYLLGPNAARVVRHAPQSVFVVRDN